jgi:uncharacterized membrane protein (DUF106 family)
MAKTIEYKVKIVNEGGEVVEKTAKSFKDLQASQASLSAELQKTDLGSKKFKELQSELKATNGAVNDAKNKTTPLLERLGEMPGIVGTAAKSVSGLGTSMKALIANPIGAVIAAISAVFIGLYKAINSTEEGAFKFKEVLAALSGVLDPVIKLAGQLGSILVDGILVGVKAVQEALKFLGFETIEKASKDAQNLAKSINQVEEAEGDLNVERAKQNKALAEAREIISDTNKSLKERQSALAKVKKSEEDLAAKETALANRKLKNIREEIRLKGQSTELLDAEEQALISLANTEQNQAAIRRKNLKAEQALVKEDEAKKKEAVEKYKTLEKERADARKASNELIKGYTLNGIKDEQEKALLGVKYAKDAQYQQINDLKVSLVEKNKLKKLADEEAGRQEKEIREKYAKEAADFEEQQTLKLIKSDDERAKKTLELANQKEIERINALKVSEEKRTELLLNQQQIFQAELDKLNLSADEKERLRKLKEIDTLIEIEALKEAKTEEQRLLQNENLKKFLKSKMDLELSALNLTTDERALIEAKYAKQIEAIDKGITDTKVSNSEKQTQAEIARLGAAADTLGSLSELLGKDTEAGKAAAVAQATINTYKGITEIIAAKSVLPEPAGSIAKGIQIAAVLATGLKSVSTIKGVNTSVPPTKAAQGGLITGVGSGTLDNIPVMVSNGESIINANSTRMFSPLLSAINEMGGGKRFGVGGVAGVDTQTSSALSLSSSISGLLDKPIKTYVVSSEVSSTQALDRQIKNRSTI